MQVKNGLARIRSNIRDHPVAAVQPLALRNIPGRAQASSGGECTLLVLNRVDRFDVLVGNNQYVRRGPWVEVAKCSDLLVLVNDLGGRSPFNNLAKDARHANRD